MFGINDRNKGRHRDTRDNDLKSRVLHKLDNTSDAYYDDADNRSRTETGEPTRHNTRPVEGDDNGRGRTNVGTEHRTSDRSRMDDTLNTREETIGETRGEARRERGRARRERENVNVTWDQPERRGRHAAPEPEPRWMPESRDEDVHGVVYARDYHGGDGYQDEYAASLGFREKDRYGVAAVIPAYNEEDDLEKCLDSVFNQSHIPDLVVVVPNNCTDNTVAVAEQYARRVNRNSDGDGPQMFVLDIGKAKHRKPEALNKFWQAFGERCEFIVGMDSDTVLHPECVEILHEEILEQRNSAGVMARYTFDQRTSRGFMSSLLLRMQRMEFTSWTLDLMRENYETYVLGGQATIFRSSSLKQIVDHYNRLDGPWSYDSAVEDMELTWKLNDRGFKTTVSRGARAYCGPMFSWKTLWAQRRKWDEGILRLMKDHDRTKYMKIPIEQDRKMWLNFIIRILFVTLFAIAYQRGAWVWFWWWILPPFFAIFLNWRISRKMPHRTVGDTIMVLTYFAMEIYLIFRMAVWATSKIAARKSQGGDRWAAQARAEGKGGGTGGKTSGGTSSVHSRLRNHDNNTTTSTRSVKSGDRLTTSPGGSRAASGYSRGDGRYSDGYGTVTGRGGAATLVREDDRVMTRSERRRRDAERGRN